jgi:hypothetical protein
MCINIFLNFVLHPIYSALVDFGTYDQWDDSFHHFFEVEQRQRVQVTKPPHSDVAIRHEDGKVIRLYSSDLTVLILLCTYTFVAGPYGR